ncbi:hypothetical protein DEU56DRAFT_285999 [Suillus clintonianus]|uniref:uncharacterized protein n=1 Tax=Suillus clintonianus TaxID=1904413 RepID=UPI001B8805D3|nr:uncharacterized protein DEU56DRAFT_285999 [Suillus clintonianus]KAG2140597.1 hypothetical protein DEU56DRAFT_285999 [Suillus clintonianus]
MFFKPFLPQIPAGFRMLSPMKNSPAREPKAPALIDNNAPPTQGLPYVFEVNSSNTTHVGRTPKTACMPKVFKKSAPIKPSPSQTAHTRRKHGHKRFTYHLSLTRPGLRRRGPRFNRPAKLQREKAVVALDKLEDIAFQTMQAGSMTDEDRIFLKQLEELRLDQLRKHSLGDARETVARADALGPQRELEHAERDRQAALRLEENARRKKEEEESRRLEELRHLEEEKRRQEEIKRKQEDYKRRAEEWVRRREQRKREREAKREEEERARLHLQRERELRAKKAAFRKAQQEAERRAREQAEQRLREEARRQERQRQEDLRRNAPQADIVAFLQLYDAKWNELKHNKNLTSVMLCEMPWPMFAQGCTSPDDISRRSLEAFIFHPIRPGIKIKSRKDIFRAEILRFHPDKFNSHFVLKLRECDRDKALEIAGAVARTLTDMMAEEIESEKS